MEMMPVESSNIRTVGYDAKTKELRVEFTQGATYSYAGVPKREFTALLKAQSVGSQFHDRIKGRYPFTKVVAAP